MPPEKSLHSNHSNCSPKLYIKPVVRDYFPAQPFGFKYHFMKWWQQVVDFFFRSWQEGEKLTSNTLCQSPKGLTLGNFILLNKSTSSHISYLHPASFWTAHTYSESGGDLFKNTQGWVCKEPYVKSSTWDDLCPSSCTRMSDLLGISLKGQ